jgi:hypothetical protein
MIHRTKWSLNLHMAPLHLSTYLLLIYIPGNSACWNLSIGTSLMWVLQQSEGVGASYVDLYRTSTIVSLCILVPCCRTSFCCQHTIAAGNFRPYHFLWCGNAPSKCIDITPTSGEMINALSLGVVTPQPRQ